MKVQVVLKDLPAYKQEFLEADLHYFKADMKYEIYETIVKLRHNRGLSFRIVNAIRKHFKIMDYTLDAFLTSLETLKMIDIIKYKVWHEGRTSYFELEIDPIYFEYVEHLRKFDPLKLSKVGFTKKELLNRLEKEIRKTYTENYEIKVLEE